ncbi:MAG: hypothetical protein IPO01_04040 [Chitinophagaceae bacterium]|nr:hypothetical protein [Chitinophagaceae bacterium]MBK9484393.1 hypothetical protein [Chitinophagaceae bacterium]MBL0198989.1 hypothetical protein [Chitinophagaceae bacterium]MBP8114021.1 hypothetical protein [Chitinophagaceae bacterium]
MRNFFIIIVLVISVDLISCSSPVNCSKYFIAYKEPIINSNQKLSLRTDGIYISKNGRAALFLFNNGKVKVYSPFFDTLRAELWVPPQKVIAEMQNAWEYKQKERWGDFFIKGNEIIIQRFNRNNEEVCKRSVFEEKGRILNDSTIEIYSEYSYWWKDKLPSLSAPCVLNFYKTNTKPDSTIAWFVNKSWYKNELNEKRK